MVNFRIDTRDFGENFGVDPRTLETADAIVAVYSIVDRNSFHLVRELLDWMTSDEEEVTSLFDPPCITCPVHILANKSDLSHIREVRYCLQPNSLVI